MPERYDLHTHSVHSDGTTTPAAIALEASELGLAGFALTDHDTTEGWAEARAAAARAGIGFLPGMEITTRYAGRSTHLLAYGLDPSHEALAAELLRVRKSRVDRAREMVRRLSADYAIDWRGVIGDPAEVVEALAGNPAIGGVEGDLIVSRSNIPEVDRVVGRPHIADALVNAGYFADRGEAFASVLRPGSSYYVPTYAIETPRAIEMVRAAGGLSVLAHPAAGRHSRSVDADALERFVAAGLWGIELEHPENRAEWIPELAAFAAERGLRVTGASDYHGAGKSNRLGECTTGPEVWNEIRAQVTTPR